MEEILREILAEDKTILSRRDDLLVALEKKVPNNLRRDYAPIKRAINLNVGEIFFVGESDKNATKAKVADILKSSGMQEARINFVIETFEKALDWDKFPKIVEENFDGKEKISEVVEENFDGEEKISEAVEENFDDEEVSQPEIKPVTETQQISPSPSQVQPPPPQRISPPPAKTSSSGVSKKFLIGGICLLVLAFAMSSGSNSSDDNSSAPPIQQTQQVQELPPPPVTQTAPPEDTSYLNAKTELSLNGIDLELPVKQLTSKWGEPSKIEKREDGNFRYLYGNMKVGIVDGIVHSFYTEDPKFKTRRGLHVGSSYAEVVEKYGANSYDMEKDDLILREYPFTSQNGKQGLLRFAVKKSTNIVHYISVRIIEEAKVSNAARLENVRYNAEKGTLRIVLDVTKATDFIKSTVENPSRLVVDLPNTTATDNFQSYARELNSDVAQRIRIAQFNDSTARVVVETRAKTKVFKLDGGPSGNRIVIDIFK